MLLALAAFFCLGSGFALASLSGVRSAPAASGLLLRLSMSAGFGLGIFSVVFVLCRLCGVASLVLMDAAVFVLLVGAALLLRNQNQPSIDVPSASPIVAGSRWLPTFLTCAFIVALGVATYSGVLRAIAHPHGEGWDAFAIWNLHARFLFRGGSHWRDGFSALIPWSHPDYPLLLPGAIAHFWTYLGNADPRLPALLALLFTFSTITILFAALSILRGQTIAVLGALSLVTTPFFIEQGAAQYADVPLSFFLLTTIAMLCLRDDPSTNPSASSRPLAIAGFAAGFAAWTKNEGLLFLASVFVARLISLVLPIIVGRAAPSSRESQRESWTGFATLFAAVAPMLVLIAWFKHSVAPPGDLFSDPSTALHKLLSPARYWAILQWYVKGFFRFGDWMLIPGTVALIGLYLIAGSAGDRKATFAARSSVLSLALTLTGYFVVYLLTPYDIYWHLRFSLTRLFLQIWPSAIFLFFVFFPASQTGRQVVR